MTPASPRPAARPVVRPVGLPVRRNRVRRATGLLTPVRAGALFVLVLTALATYGVGASQAFVYRRLEVQAPAGAITTTADVIQALGLDRTSPNLFMMRTDRYAKRLLVLPAVLDAEVTTTLPDLITVRLVERVPVVIWNVGGHRFLVDRTGLAFAPAILGGSGAVASGGAAAAATASPGASTSPGSAKASPRSAAVLHAASPGTSAAPAAPVVASAPAASAASAAQAGDPADRNPADGLPIVTDRRTASAGLDVGGHIDPVDLDAATRLAGVRPADIGSGAAELRVSIEDGDGYVLRPVGVPWVARFGLFTPSIRTPDMIPGQVRLLHSFLAGREMTVKSVTLADDRSGTWVSR